MYLFPAGFTSVEERPAGNPKRPPDPKNRENNLNQSLMISSCNL
jgi:hypothetical protein